jgi:hypothetical protein
VSWTAAFERHPSGFRYDLGAQFAAGATASAAPTGTAYGAKYTTINFANGVAIASILILESYRLSITRSASDTLGADAYISTVSIRNLT